MQPTPEELAKIAQRVCNLDDFVDEKGLNLFDEIPQASQVTPATLLHLNSRIGFYGMLMQRAEKKLREKQRERKNERSTWRNRCYNPQGDPPIKKTTGDAVDAWVDTRPTVWDLNDKVDEAESDYFALRTVYEVLKLTRQSIETYTKTVYFDEKGYAGASDSPSPIENAVERIRQGTYK